MIVRLHLADGSIEDHPLLNAVHFADYIRRVDVPGSEFAMSVGGQQIRYLEISPTTDKVVTRSSSLREMTQPLPIVVAITVEPINLETSH